MRHFHDTTTSPMPRAVTGATTAVDAAPAVRVDITASTDALLALREDWETLARATPAASPFQDFDWAAAWVRAFVKEGESSSPQPYVILVRAGGRPLLLWPLQIDRHAGMRRLTWLSMPALQYGGVLTAELSGNMLQEALEAAWEAIRRAPVDYVDLRLLPEHSPVARFLSGRCHSGCANRSFLVDLSGHADWRSYELSLSRSARRSRKKRLNRMARAGELRFRVHDDEETFTRLATVAVTWKREWLHAHGISGALPERREFLGLLHALGRTEAGGRGGGHWVAAELSLDGQPMAIDIGAIRGGRFHSFLSAYDADHADLSPGKVALWLMLRWCKENGIDVYDMLANAAPYKEDWATHDVPLHHFIHPRTAGGLAYALWASRLRTFAMGCYRVMPDRLRRLASCCLSGFRA